MMNMVFSHTHIPLQLWFYAMLHFSNSAEGVNSVFLARHLGISGTAAFRMAQKIRLHMTALDACEQLGGDERTIEIRLERIRGVFVPGLRKNQIANVLLMSDHQRVSSYVLGKPRRHILRSILHRNCRPDSRFITTCYLTYRASSEFGSRRPLVDHVPDFYYHQEEDRISGFEAYFRKPLAFNYRRVDHENLWLYLKEFEFRYNRRQESERTFWDLVSRFPDCSEQSKAQLKSAYMLASPDQEGT